VNDFKHAANWENCYSLSCDMQLSQCRRKGKNADDQPRRGTTYNSFQPLIYVPEKKKNGHAEGGGKGCTGVTGMSKGGEERQEGGTASEKDHFKNLPRQSWRE